MPLFSHLLYARSPLLFLPLFFFFNDTATTEIYTLSLHDALPILSVTARTPRAYNRPASSAIWVLRGNRCWPCQCSPVTPTFHSTVPRAARVGSVSAIWRSASATAG